MSFFSKYPQISICNDSPQLYTLECATKHRYYCYPITFEDNGLYENVSLDENGVPIVKQGDVIDTVNFTTMTDTQKIDSIMNLTFGPKLLQSDTDLGFELEIGQITLELAQGPDAPSPMAQFDFKGLNIGMGSVEKWLALEFLVPDATYVVSVFECGKS